MFVEEILGTHNLVLNKFNVVDHHLILATTDFQHQSEPLNAKDLAALYVLCMSYHWLTTGRWAVISSLNCLGFYNCGPLSGARYVASNKMPIIYFILSQPHKHLQLLPLPMNPASLHDCPVESIIFQAPPSHNNPFRLDNFRFKHASVLLDQRELGTDSNEALATSGKYIESVYSNLLDTLKQDGLGGDFSYNFLMTKKWMLVVPRKEEKFGSIPLCCAEALINKRYHARPLRELSVLCTSSLCNQCYANSCVVHKVVVHYILL